MRTHLPYTEPSSNLLILTDASGFTTACRVTEEAALAEVSRLALRVPIIVRTWKRVNDRGPLNGWKLMAEFNWDGLLGGRRWSLS